VAENVATPDPTPDPTPGQRAWSLGQRGARALLIPALAIFTALVIGAAIIWLTTGSLATALAAYAGLLEGALGSPRAIAGTLVRATPYAFTGLAVALAFKCGLFNIGAEGQLALGALCAAGVGYAFRLPALLHIPLAILAGIAGGFVWGAVPGLLKARSGAHEVITTIMMNYLALQIVQVLLSGAMKDPRTVAAQTPPLAPTSWLPMLIPALQLHSGVLLAVLVAIAIWWFLGKTIWGFELKTVGVNPAAARYAGMPVARNVILALALSGGLAGLAGAVEVTGVALDVTRVTPDGTRYFGLGFSSGYGFDAIAVALLGRGNPFGVVAAALLFGGLRAGATKMQFDTQVPSEIISVIQGLILLFVAAEVIIRRIYRVRATADGAATPALTSGWGEKAA